MRLGRAFGIFFWLVVLGLIVRSLLLFWINRDPELWWHTRAILSPIGVNLEEALQVKLRSEMRAAIASGDPQKFSRFLSEHPLAIEIPVEQGRLPLHFAALRGELEMVKFIISSGGDVNRRDVNSAPPLLLAVQGGHLEVSEFLLKMGADPNLQDTDGVAPIHMAAHAGSHELVKLLLDSGADVQARAGPGVLAVDMALANGHDGLARLLAQEDN